MRTTQNLDTTIKILENTPIPALSEKKKFNWFTELFPACFPYDKINTYCSYHQRRSLELELNSIPLCNPSAVQGTHIQPTWEGGRAYPTDSSLGLRSPGQQSNHGVPGGWQWVTLPSVPRVRACISFLSHSSTPSSKSATIKTKKKNQ